VASSNGHHAGGAAKGAELNEVERRRKVANMVASHYTDREISEALGVASSTISADVKAVREQWRQRFRDDYGNVLGEELARLDLFERALMAKALSGGPDGGVDLRAVDGLLAIWDRRVRMLGLDSPGRVEVTAKLELIAKAIEAVLSELGVDTELVRPLLAAKLRELDAITEK
jgi:DNA-binding CsgD family transcriptional regulator